MSKVYNNISSNINNDVIEHQYPTLIRDKIQKVVEQLDKKYKGHYYRTPYGLHFQADWLLSESWRRQLKKATAVDFIREGFVSIRNNKMILSYFGQSYEIE